MFVGYQTTVHNVWFGFIIFPVFEIRNFCKISETNSTKFGLHVIKIWYIAIWRKLNHGQDGQQVQNEFHSEDSVFETS